MRKTRSRDAKQLIAALQKANDELTMRAAILDMAYDAIFLYSPDAKLIYANEAARRLYSYTKEEFNDFYVTQLVLPREIAEYENRIKAVLEQGNISAEVIHKRKDGSLIPVETHSRRVETEGKQYIISIIRDISERRQAEEQLKENEKQLKSIFDALTEGVALIAPNGYVIRANMAEAKAFGENSPEGRVGKYFTELEWKHIHTDGTPLPIEESAVMTSLKKKLSVRNLEIGIVKEDGRSIWLNINTVPVIDESGEVVGVVRSSTDVTEQKTLRDESEQFTRKLLDAQEEERKRISRELHDDTAQYLALLILEIGSLINLCENENMLEAVLTRLKGLRTSSSNALQEVRRFSHELRPSVLESFGLTAALELIVNEFNADKKVEVTLDITGKETRLPDKVELVLFRIFQEALSNIRKHSQATQAKVHLDFAPNKVKLIISDNGKGFDLEKKDRHIGKGSLGLVGMRERAHLIGASLAIKSKPGHGTVISVDLPR
jgi:PAS domain S-box-containing protein